ncbi:SRPBCC family protein [Streptomyces amakusaensis]|uniref:SRPBCC domain-containing protein n=1 Tax=Streptomyces amakusaensis TaxID=67271 RepID=A0ABW0ATT4_9ACTN
MSEIADRIDDVRREVGTRPPAGAPEDTEGPAGEEVRTVLLARAFDAPPETVWRACTDPERVGRWFLPLGGDLRPGGHYRLEGNAGGEILDCEPPRLLRVSWLFGESPGFGEVELRLAPEPEDGGRTAFELEHIAVVPPGMWDRFGPGAVGVGWDLALLGLDLHLLGRPVGDPAAWQVSDEAREFIARSAERWGAAHRASGAPEDVAASAARETTAFYAPPGPPEDSAETA